MTTFQKLVLTLNQLDTLQKLRDPKIGQEQFDKWVEDCVDIAEFLEEDILWDVIVGSGLPTTSTIPELACIPQIIPGTTSSKWSLLTAIMTSNTAR